MSEQTAGTVTPSTGNAREEYSAARERAALFEMPGRTHIELTGADRAKFLHNFCTNDIRKLTPGRGCEAFITNVQGKVLAHIFVFAEDNALWIESGAGAAERILAHLSRYQISEDVTFADRTHEVATLYLAGPEAHAVLRRAGCEAPAENLSHSGTPRVRRNDLLNVPGYSLVCQIGEIDTLRRAILAAGATPAGAAAFEALRIEAGLPVYGVDVSDANLAQEVSRTSQAISFTKGCYLGQEPIARIDALGHVNQQLRVLRLSAGPEPAPGSDIFARGASPDAKPVGRVTSSALVPVSGLPVALAYVRRGHDASGTEVEVGTAKVPATVWWPEAGAAAQSG